MNDSVATAGGEWTRMRETASRPSLLRAWAGPIAAAAGLLLYLWPAVNAPVVLWSDSRVDLGWGHAGVLGSRQAIASASTRYLEHPLKIGYLGFLRLATWTLPSVEETRAIVVVQSSLLWLAIGMACLYVARLSGNTPMALSLYVLLILFLRLRDSTSAIMSEAISTALALPLGAVVLFSPRTRASRLVAWGAACGILYSVRPNLGLLVFGFALVIHLGERRAAGLAAAGFAGVFLPLWMLAHARDAGHPLREIATPVLGASADYLWPAARPPRSANPADEAQARLTEARSNWKRLISDDGADGRRQLIWRTLHGTLGTEFYDSRWSASYRRLDTASRILTPFATIAALGILLAFPFSGARWTWNLGSIFLLLGIVAQNFLLGSQPRLVLPLLPILWLLAVAGIDALRERGWKRQGAAVVLTAGLLLVTSKVCGVVDWQSGRIERSGVEIVQRIPKLSLPRTPPVTLHIRIAPALLPTTAHLAILGPDDRTLYWSPADPHRDRPFVTLTVPPRLLEANQRGAVELRLISVGDYGPASALDFPVVPIPWGERARRVGGPELSPSTGITAGSLDWWAHPGAP